MTMMRKTYKFRLYPSKRQTEALTGQLAEACRLYNAALQERRDAWRINHTSLDYYSQAAQLKEIRAAGDLGITSYSAAQDVLRRVQRTFEAFFARVRRGARPGFPRFKSAARFDSLTFPEYGKKGCKLLESGKLRVQGVGEIKVKLHRELEGKIKTATLKREAGRWFVCFMVECEEKPLPPCPAAVGVDVGLSAFATLSDGMEINNPCYFRQAQAALRRAQRKVSRRKRGGNRRRKAVAALQRMHAHIRNQRADFHHKAARTLVNGYGLIAVEDLNVKGLASGMLAKPVNDAGWSLFISKLTYKAVEAGRVLVKVDPRGTSQRCVCGADVPKTLKQRRHQCGACGLSVGRDHASALEILARGLRVQAVTCAAAQSVA